MLGLGTKDSSVTIFGVASEASSIGPWLKKWLHLFHVYFTRKLRLIVAAVKRWHLLLKCTQHVGLLLSLVGDVDITQQTVVGGSVAIKCVNALLLQVEVHNRQLEAS
jgi:hypothetical protein